MQFDPIKLKSTGVYIVMRKTYDLESHSDTSNIVAVYESYGDAKSK